jgi:hypothetical protein
MRIKIPASVARHLQRNTDNIRTSIKSIIDASIINEGIIDTSISDDN